MVTTGQIRSEVIVRMRAALKTGMSGAAFFRELRERGLSYRRTTMLADWRSAGNIEKKTGLLKYVRKDYLPSPALYAEVTWKLSREYFYKLKVHTRIRPGEPVQEKFINIINDRPMTPGEWESEIQTLWAGMYRGVVEEVVSIEPILAVRQA